MENKSHVYVNDVVVDIGGNKKELGRMAPGEKKKASGYPGAIEHGPLVAFYKSGKLETIDLGQYLTSSIPLQCHVVVQDDEVKKSCKDVYRYAS